MGWSKQLFLGVLEVQLGQERSFIGSFEAQLKQLIGVDLGLHPKHDCSLPEVGSSQNALKHADQLDTFPPGVDGVEDNHEDVSVESSLD